MAGKLFQMCSKFAVLGMGGCCFYVSRAFHVCTCQQHDEAHSKRSSSFTRKDNRRLDMIIREGGAKHPWVRSLEELIEREGPHSRKTNDAIPWNFGYAVVKVGLKEMNAGATETSEEHKKKLVAMVFCVLVESADKLGFIWENDKEHQLTACQLHPMADWDKIKIQRQVDEQKRKAAEQEKRKQKAARKKGETADHADDDSREQSLESIEMEEKKPVGKKNRDRKGPGKSKGKVEPGEKKTAASPRKASLPKDEENVPASPRKGSVPKDGEKASPMKKQPSAADVRQAPKTPRGEKPTAAGSTTKPTTPQTPKSARATWSPADFKTAASEDAGIKSAAKSGSTKDLGVASPKKESSAGAEPKTPRGTSKSVAAAATADRPRSDTNKSTNNLLKKTDASSSSRSINAVDDSATTPRTRGKSASNLNSRPKSTANLDDA